MEAVELDSSLSRRFRRWGGSWGKHENGFKITDRVSVETLLCAWTMVMMDVWTLKSDSVSVGVWG